MEDNLRKILTLLITTIDRKMYGRYDKDWYFVRRVVDRMLNYEQDYDWAETQAQHETDIADKYYGQKDVDGHHR